MSNAILPNAMPPVLLSGFSDEAANQKTAEQQFCAFAALGLRYYTLRFIDAGAGIQNAMLLAPESIDRILSLQAEYGLGVSSLGSPIGKVKLLEIRRRITRSRVRMTLGSMPTAHSGPFFTPPSGPASIKCW